MSDDGKAIAVPQLATLRINGWYRGTSIVLGLVGLGAGGAAVFITHVEAGSAMTAYITAKGGVVALTKSLALEIGRSGITVNAVAPGATETPLNSETYTPEVRAAYAARIAVGRIAQPSDIATAVVYLASDEASYVTGHELVVDGGLVLDGNTGFPPTS